jgi:plasmid stabilization system protein ParE
VKVGWTERASLDLERVLEFRRRPDFDPASNEAAIRLHQQLVAAADGLATFPLIGRPLGRYRRIVAGDCLIVYEILRRTKTIAILRVRHGKELPFGFEDDAD